jgi:hypothetical protein
MTSTTTVRAWDDSLSYIEAIPQKVRLTAFQSSELRHLQPVLTLLRCRAHRRTVIVLVTRLDLLVIAPGVAVLRITHLLISEMRPTIALMLAIALRTLIRPTLHSLLRLLPFQTEAMACNKHRKTSA